MKNRFVLKCNEWEEYDDNPVYIKSIEDEGDSFGFYVTEDINKAKRFSNKEAIKWSDEIYDSYCDDFEVVQVG